MKKLLIVVCSLLSISLLGGYSVCKLPEDGGVDPTIVHTETVLLPGTDMIPFDAPEFSIRAADPREYKVRYIVEVYTDDKFDQSLQSRRRFTYDEGNTEDVTLECDLHARNYRVVTWRDFVPASRVPGNVADDCSYTTLGFSAVKLKGDYTGRTGYKDMLCGQAALDLSPYRRQSEVGHREEMQLECPLAEVELIITGIVKCLSKLGQTKSVRDAAIDDFTVRALHTGYFPVGFGIVSNHPNEAVVGIKFTSNSLVLSGSEACLAFDYVLVNGEESSVTLEMIICNKGEQEVNHVTEVEVPLKWSKVTMVRDEFLTREFVSGIGIDSGFDGEIDVVAPRFFYSDRNSCMSYSERN